jgi:hypothetical protein
VRFGQLIEPSGSGSTTTLCVYKKADRKVVKYVLAGGAINKSTSTVNYDSAPANCTIAFGTDQSVFNTRATATAFEVTKVGGASTTVYPAVSSVTIRLQVITGTADATGIACATKDIYCNSLTLNTAVNIRGSQ